MIASTIAVLVNIIFFVSYFVFSLRVRQYVVGEFSYSELITSFKVGALVIGIIATVLIVAMFWFVSALILKDAKQLCYEMKQIAAGNLDVEVKESTYDIFRQMSVDLKTVRLAIKTIHENSRQKEQEKTRLLTKKITDLEKLRDLTTDSILLAKSMQQERDQLLLQLHQLQDKRKMV